MGSKPGHYVWGTLKSEASVNVGAWFVWYGLSTDMRDLSKWAKGT